MRSGCPWCYHPVKQVMDSVHNQSQWGNGVLTHNMMPSLGYIPSWKPAQGKPVPKILDGLETLAKLIKECHDYIIKQKSKNKGKDVVKSLEHLANGTCSRLRQTLERYTVLAWKVLTGLNDRAQQRLKLQPPFLNPLTPQRHASTSS